MSGDAESFANTNDGDVLDVGTNSGYVYKFPNLNVRCDTTSYPPGSTEPLYILRPADIPE